jgi:GGDEF domain-containing protein
MKAMVDARRRADLTDLTTWGCVIVSLVLFVFCLQILDVRRARGKAEQAHGEAEQSRAQLFYQANHDVLTCQANRRLFGQILREEIARSGCEGLGAGLFCFDLDGFKSVNDSFGHQTGDELLIAVAARLRAAFAGDRYTRIVARWLGPRRLRVLGDSEYAGGSISRSLPDNAELISRMTMKAALCAAARSLRRPRAKT